MTRSETFQFTGRHMLAIMVAFFSVVIAANMTMVYFASSSWTGLVVKNSYVASQEFNEKTALLERAEAGLHVTLAYDANRISVLLKTDSGEAFFAPGVTLRLGRPSHEGEDREYQLHSEGNGVYVISASLAPGQWSGMLTAKSAGHEDWQRPVRLLVKE